MADWVAALASVQQHGNALEHVSREMRSDREIVMAAVSQNGRALRYASDELKVRPCARGRVHARAGVRDGCVASASLQRAGPGICQGDRVCTTFGGLAGSLVRRRVGCVRACVGGWVRAWVRGCVRAWVRACVRTYVHILCVRTIVRHVRACLNEYTQADRDVALAAVMQNWDGALKEVGNALRYARAHARTRTHARTRMQRPQGRSSFYTRCNRAEW